jgi:choline-sulfatase
MQIDYDEEVEHVAVQKIYDLARHAGEQPFFMTVSFTHPHPPFVAPQEHWDAYSDEEIDAPTVAEIPYEQLDPHSQWLYLAHGQDRHTITADHVRRARRAYYAMASYVDEKIGKVLAALARAGLADDTVVVFCADHGEMMGERGMWFKQTFYEWSARVPLMVAWPGVTKPSHCGEVCSLVDLLPTFLDITREAAAPVQPVEPLDGRSLLPLLRGQGGGQAGEAISEYSSEGVCAPSRMVRRGRFKYIYTRGLPPMLFDLEQDPHELRNLAGQPDHAANEETLHARAMDGWDPVEVHQRILLSQRRRLFLKAEAQRKGQFPDWTYEARDGDSARFVRPTTHGGAVGPKPRARFPFVQPTPPDRPGRTVPG